METGKKIYFGFHIIYFALATGFLLCIFKIFDTQYINGDIWEKISKKMKNTSKRELQAKRGTIFWIDNDGNNVILSSDFDAYEIYFSGAQLANILKSIEKKEIRIKNFDYKQSVRQLSEMMANYFGDKSAQSYENLIIGALKSKTKVKLLQREISHIELLEIVKYPLLKGGIFASCLDKKTKANRVMPYGDLAARTIGKIYKDTEKKGGRFGIEAQFDSILRGENGTARTLQLGLSTFATNVEIPAQNGADITLTLDMDMQEIVEKCLLQQAQRLGAERACAILMEVETGEIKAMANLYQSANGYFEGGNMAIADMNPPGSTFKTISMMIALDNKIVAYDSIVNSFDKRYPKVTDHAPRESWRAIPASDVLVYSSNVGVSNIIGGAFEQNPMAFVKEIQKTKVNEEFNIMLPGAARFKIGSIKHKNDTINRLDLPTLSFGYQAVVPPIYMLRFYNAIANGGKLINPFLVKNISRDGKSVKELIINGKTIKFPAKTQTVNSSICSKKTLKQIQKMLYDVVGKRGGTGHEYRSQKVGFAGKTGTAVFKTDGVETDQVSFCGYFPADSTGVVKPKYSCIVVMQRKGLWGSQSCEVFRNIAEKIYCITTPKSFAEMPDTISYSPKNLDRNNKKIDYLKKYLKIK